MFRRIPVLTSCLLLLFSTAAFAGQEDFRNANALYKKGEFSRALDLYEQMSSSGVRNAAVYFNAGNCYYKINRYGSSLLAYERAKTIIPRDPDLKLNIAAVYTKLGRLPDKQSGISLHTLADSITIRENIWLLSALYFLICLCFALTILFRSIKQVVLPFVFVLTLVFGLFSATLYLKNISAAHDSIAVKDAAAKFEPIESSDVNFKVIEGDRVFILGAHEGWVKIRNAEGIAGWVKEADVEKISR